MDDIKQGLYLRHFPQGYSQEIRDYVHKLFKHYIFTDNFGGFVGYCTHCGEKFPLSEVTIGEFYKNGNLKHNIYAECPCCHHECIIKNASRGHKTMIDEVYCIYYEKSVLDPKIMVARGIYAVRDYRGDYEKTKVLYGTKAFYYYEMGNTAMFERYVYYSRDSRDNSVYEGEISERKKFNSFARTWPFTKQDFITDCCWDSIDAAVKGTPFQYSCYDDFTGYDGLITYFDLYSRYPVIEKLIKIGFYDVVYAKLHNNPTYGAINWRAQTVQKALRINKNEIKNLKESKLKIDCHYLRLYQLSNKYHAKLDFEELYSLHSNNIWPEDLSKLLKYAPFRKLINYAKRQSEISKNSISLVLRDYKDYISDCIDLEKDLTKDSVLFPKDIVKAHEATTKQIKHKGNAILNRKISDRAKELANYCFEYNGLLIRPAASQTELIKEGDVLHHCVGRYAEDYAKGKTDIFFIRKTAAPNKSFYTLELKNNQIAQCRGKSNKSYTQDEDIKAFVEEFEKEKLTKKKSNRVKITA